MTMPNPILDTIRSEYQRYKTLGEKALAQVAPEDLSRPVPGGGNSLATLVWHISGNLRSRFTDFRTADGEKPWRRRDEEFVERPVGRDEVLSKWESGWRVLFAELDALTDGDLGAAITIRAEPMTIALALQRSVTHTAYHVGQVVFLAKQWRGESWTSLSIPVGMSKAVNRKMGYDTPDQLLEVAAVSPASPEAEALIAELDRELGDLYPGLPLHGLHERDIANPLVTFVVGRFEGETVACGATRPLEPGVAEIKRMYVRPSSRGRGFSKQILAALEETSRRAGINRIVLETGYKQLEAISLYRSEGYTPAPAYGEYEGNDYSRCFEKQI